MLCSANHLIYQVGIGGDNNKPFEEMPESVHSLKSNQDNS
jgi:hypothetical protein